MTTNTVSKFHQNPSRSVKWFLYNSLHIYRESLLNPKMGLRRDGANTNPERDHTRSMHVSFKKLQSIPYFRFKCVLSKNFTGWLSVTLAQTRIPRIGCVDCQNQLNKSNSLNLYPKTKSYFREMRKSQNINLNPIP